MDVLPEVWKDMIIFEERRAHYKEWTTTKAPVIELAERKRQLNGFNFTRKMTIACERPMTTLR